MTSFKLVGRGFRDTIVLVPGWAADHRIFDALDLEFNYLIPTEFSPKDFEERLIGKLEKENLKKISILGSSLGGFLAADFASKYPEAVKETVFIGMRPRYHKDGLDEVRGLITKNREAYLRSFYHAWFSPAEKEALDHFKKTLMRDYIKDMKEETLSAGLDYLSDAKLDAAKLRTIETRFIHGTCDKIAPVEEISELEKLLPGSDFTILAGAGHLPFLNNNFKEIFYGRQDR